jgi:hypothetical protein
MNQYNVYTRLNGKLAQWEVVAESYLAAINTVKESLETSHSTAVLATLVKPA